MIEICFELLESLFPLIPAFVVLILVFNLISDLLWRN